MYLLGRRCWWQAYVVKEHSCDCFQQTSSGGVKFVLTLSVQEKQQSYADEKSAGGSMRVALRAFSPSKNFLRK